MHKRPTLDFIYFDAGGGHRSAAMALEAVIKANGYDWNLRLVNLQEILDSLDIFRKLTGIRLQDIYNLVLAKGWTLGSTFLLPCMHWVIRLYHPAQVRLLREYWRAQRPDMVVSLIPNFNLALFQSLQQALPGTPLVTILTDLADYPPHFWIENQKQYLVCGTAKALEQAKSMGYSDSQIFSTSGMILRPQFYDRPILDQASERLTQGLDPHLPTVLVLFGGEGSNVMFSIAKRLGNCSRDLQLIMICGKNRSLRKRLERLKTKNKIHLEGFTKEIPYFMDISDFLIGKPGPGSISEALQMGLPVIVERNAWTLPQERYNAAWIKEQQVGIVLHNFREVEGAVQELLQNDRLSAMKARIKTMKNRAVFEIPPFLERILTRQLATVAVNE